MFWGSLCLVNSVGLVVILTILRLICGYSELIVYYVPDVGGCLHVARSIAAGGFFVWLVCFAVWCDLFVCVCCWWMVVVMVGCDLGVVLVLIACVSVFAEFYCLGLICCLWFWWF